MLKISRDFLSLLPEKGCCFNQTTGNNNIIYDVWYTFKFHNSFLLMLMYLYNRLASKSRTRGSETKFVHLSNNTICFYLAAKITSRTLYQGPLDCLRKLYIDNGFKGWFQGAQVTFFRDVPGFAVYFGAIEKMSEWATRPGESPSQIGTLKLMIVGGLGGMISWFSTFPLDVIKSRMQADGNRGKFIYKSAMDCALKSYRNEGLSVFYKGLGPTLLRAFPCNAAVYSVYALVYRLMSNNAILSREAIP